MTSRKSDITDVVNLAHPHVRRIDPTDLVEALTKGFDDFIAMPTFSFFLVIVYPVIGLILFWLTFGLDMMQLVLPLMTGFALIGPLAAIGLYELSRRREQGLDISLAALQDIHFPCIRGIVALGIVLLGLFFFWLVAAMEVYRLSFGDWVPPSFAEFAAQVLTTPAGWTLIVVGCFVGLIFGIVAFSISVVSIPLLLDHDVDFATAVETSVRAVLENPRTMAMWALIVAGALLVGSLPFLVGLVIVFPILGHSTWHLYRAVVEA
ncbi:DUF2189 domain-containing protein [Hyphomicrobium sp. CS1GBMeth3]|uniref:DUF2189 domain-containing protein n=1 Tax=Hyphomicrobium sp. CS1GBMeth3 TaxID=1892845 RepID=UPI00092FF8F5|nr:DUF2189 domain-containing protein [Hyphomicrobium sp. CS1GBMeth3]